MFRAPGFEASPSGKLVFLSDLRDCSHVQALRGGVRPTRCSVWATPAETTSTMASSGLSFQAFENGNAVYVAGNAGTTNYYSFSAGHAGPFNDIAFFNPWGKLQTDGSP